MMAIYFSIIIPFPIFISELKDTIYKYDIKLYAEKWNEEREFYYELIDYKSESVNFFSDKDYLGFFFLSKVVEIKDGNLILEKSINNDKVSFYDDAFFAHSIEGKGGREDRDNLEIIRLRIISKTPDKEISKFYNSLQSVLKKLDGVEKGLFIGKHFDNKVFYYKTDKNMLLDFNKKEIKYLKQN